MYYCMDVWCVGKSIRRKRTVSALRNMANKKVSCSMETFIAKMLRFYL